MLVRRRSNGQTWHTALVYRWRADTACTDAPQEWIVICGSASWDLPVRLAEQHVAVQLAARAHVLFVDPPISVVGARRRPDLARSLEGPRLRKLGPRLLRLTPVVVPGKDRPGLVHLTQALTRRALRRACRSLPGVVRAVILTLPHYELFGACGEERRVYWAKDDHQQGASLYGLSSSRVRRIEDGLASTADVLIVSSSVLAEEWRRRGREPLLVPNGCDPDLAAHVAAARPADDVGLSAPVVGFLGTLSDRIDFDVLDAVADRGHSLLLVGSRRRTFSSARFERLLVRPNVRWVGARPFHELAPYLRAIDVGIVPYARNAYNDASFPLKILEYLAAGLPVVSTELPAVRWLGTDLIDVASGPSEFATAVERAITALPTSDAARRRAFATEHGWDRRTDQLTDTLGIHDADLASTS